MRIVRIVLAVTLVIAVVLAGLPYVAPEPVARALMSLGRWSAGLERREVDIPGGLRYVYLDGGEGEPLVLLHGFGGMKDNFVLVARQLTPHYRVIIPDQIGFAESSHPEDADYSVQGQADHIHALMQALGVSRLHLGGNSMGGMIALAYAARYPAEVESLWLLDPGGIWSGPKSELFRIIEAGGHNPLLPRNEDEFAALTAMVMSKPPFVPRPVLDVVARDALRNQALRQRIIDTIRRDSLEERIAGLVTPALIVWGAEDRLIHPGTADVLHRLLPNSRVVIMPGIGHAPMMEAPRESATDYLNFRKSLAGQPSHAQ